MTGVSNLKTVDPHLPLGMMSFKFRCSRFKTSKPHFYTTAGEWLTLGTLNTPHGQVPTKRVTQPSFGRPAVWGKQLKMCIQLPGTMQYTSYRSSAPELQRQGFKILFKHQNIILELISLNQPGSFSLPLGFKGLLVLETPDYSFSWWTVTRHFVTNKK